jgi:hypothetical protein
MNRFCYLIYDVCLRLDFMPHKTKNPKNSATNFSDFLLFLVENTEGSLRLDYFIGFHPMLTYIALLGLSIVNT